MELVAFDADDTTSVEAFARVRAATLAVDAPWEQPLTPYRLEMSMRHGFDGDTGRFFLLRDGGEVVGTVMISTSDYDNLEAAWVILAIGVEFRRNGRGRAALDLVLQRCRDLGRPSVLLHGWDSEAARRLAAATSFELNATEMLRIQTLDRSRQGRDRIEELRDEARGHAGDYELVRIQGRTPDDVLPALVTVTAAINDAPRDDLDYEDLHFDLERIRSYEAIQEAKGYRLYRLLARHRATGEIAGLSVVCVDSELPAYGDQHDTSVLPEHRGHRLGLLLKAEMVLWLLDAEPDLCQITTENAESNGPMIAVNERLGYEVAGRQLVFQRRLD